ncbi:hypothetical protein K0V43_20315, partial [Leptospira sp. id769339]|nr:hypothetical protein [Leptospira sp. id769339]
MQATTLNKNKITIPFTPVKEWKKEVQEFSSSIKNLSTSLVNVLGSICEESVSASPLSEKEIATLVEDSANASGAVIHQVLSNAIYNDSTYNY